jgi:hypothetical protein
MLRVRKYDGYRALQQLLAALACKWPEAAAAAAAATTLECAACH